MSAMIASSLVDSSIGDFQRAGCSPGVRRVHKFLEGLGDDDGHEDGHELVLVLVAAVAISDLQELLQFNVRSDTLVCDV